MADATFLFRKPGHLVRALVSMNVLMPLTALAVGAPFDLHPAVKIALVVISVSPTPPILPKKIRMKWKDKGVELESSLTQFYQGVSSGGTGTSSEYNGTAQAELKFDLGKLAGWNHWSAEIKAETRLAAPWSPAPGRSVL